MFHELNNQIKNNQTLFHLLEKLAHAGYIKQHVDSSGLTEADLEEVWQYYYEEPDKAVNFLETMHGFIFEQEHTQESMLGIKDWNRVVASAKDFLEEQDGEVDAAMERLEKVMSFLSPLEVRRAVEQAQEEMEENDG
jgi:aminoglycoside N3'-acetyltransferase